MIQHATCTTCIKQSSCQSQKQLLVNMYTMHNIFSSFLCLTSFFHLGALSNIFNDNDQIMILGKLNHELTDAILLKNGMVSGPHHPIGIELTLI